MIRPLTASSLSGIGFSFAAARGSRATVPVQAANYIYSHFRHVSGVPAPDGLRGFAVTRLKILDSMIERISQAERNALIRSAPAAAHRINAYNPARQLPLGNLVDLVA
ncbi:MAG: hypothetical protein LBC77_08970 [Spirochaetaceae bacterium]|nr:hypothetical protein [Spirochaetaceae bacterium]